MKTLSDYCLETFGEKLYKLSLNAGLSCPNRDGTLGRGGCIFCSAGGSGDFAGDPAMGISEQLDREKARVAGKFRGSRYIAYYQAYTNTYAPIEVLKRLYAPAMARPDIAAVSIATRPDCLGPQVLELLGRMNREKPVWVELGLQTIHPKSAGYIRRGYPLEVYDGAADRLAGIGIHTVTHLILGLPGESREDMLASVRHVAAGPGRGIKLQLLHVLRGTDLARDYLAGRVRVMSLDEYADLVADCVALLPPDMVVHRLTGDGDKRALIAPEWSGDKKRVLNAVNSRLREKNLI